MAVKNGEENDDTEEVKNAKIKNENLSAVDSKVSGDYGEKEETNGKKIEDLKKKIGVGIVEAEKIKTERRTQQLTLASTGFEERRKKDKTKTAIESGERSLWGVWSANSAAAGKGGDGRKPAVEAELRRTNEQNGTVNVKNGQSNSRGLEMGSLKLGEPFYRQEGEEEGQMTFSPSTMMVESAESTTSGRIKRQVSSLKALNLPPTSAPRLMQSVERAAGDAHSSEKNTAKLNITRYTEYIKDT